MTKKKPNPKNVSASKPKIGGAVFVAPLGTTLPTDAETEKEEGFECLGYITTDGVKNTVDRDKETVKAWGGDTVVVLDKGVKDSFSFTMLESLSIEVLKLVYGADKVSGDLENGLTFKVASGMQPEYSFVIETVLRDGIAQRLVIPRAAVEKVDELKFADGSAVTYGVTLLAGEDEHGVTHYGYLKKGV